MDLKKKLEYLSLNSLRKFKSGGSIKYGKLSYSQCGEDLIIQYIFDLRGIHKLTYIDIGANDPFYLSNTALFYQKGCRGINIEPNPDLMKIFFHQRPEDINLNAGIGPKAGEMDFYMMDDPTLSSFSQDEVKKYEDTGLYKLTEIKKIHITTIREVLDKYTNGGFPDFLSLDAEGMDYDILKSIDFNKTRPKVICVEAAEYSAIGAGKRRNELINYLVKKDYYEYANTNLNAIMVLNDFWFK